MTYSPETLNNHCTKHDFWKAGCKECQYSNYPVCTGVKTQLYDRGMPCGEHLTPHGSDYYCQNEHCSNYLHVVVGGINPKLQRS